MITDPDKYAPEFIKAGADWISIHPETSQDPKKCLAKIHELGAQASIAVNPDTPLERVEAHFPDIDMLLIMTVFPGFGGQAFMEEILPKIEQSNKALRQQGLPVLIEADGGIKSDNISRVVQAGAQVIVSGSGIFKTPDYAETIRKMRDTVGK